MRRVNTMESSCAAAATRMCSRPRCAAPSTRSPTRRSRTSSAARAGTNAVASTGARGEAAGGGAHVAPADDARARGHLPARRCNRRALAAAHLPRTAPSVRLAATDALYALLVSVAPRATRYVLQWHKQLLTGASNAFGRDANNHAAVHGGLLALSCLLRVASSDFVLREDGWYSSQNRSLGPNQSAFTFAWAAASRYRRRSGATPISPARHCGSWSTSSTSRPACLPHAACRIVCAC